MYALLMTNGSGQIRTQVRTFGPDVRTASDGCALGLLGILAARERGRVMIIRGHGGKRRAGRLAVLSESKLAGPITIPFWASLF